MARSSLNVRMCGALSVLFVVLLVLPLPSPSWTCELRMASVMGLDNVMCI
jgi:hypothetical protein